MIRVNEISISFGRQSVINNLSFNVSDGSTTVLLGKNGAGKSVVLKAVAGLIPLNSGTIDIDGTNPGPEAYRKEIPLLSYVFQKGGLFDSMNVFENVSFYLQRKLIPSAEIDKRTLDIIERVGLAGAELKLPSELSGGMQKRVCLARAVISGASHILYDDPSAGLDPVLTDSIGALIREIRQKNGVTSILVTHDLALVKKVADKIILIDNGMMVYSNTVENFFSTDDIYARQFIDGCVTGPIKVL